MRPYEKQTGVTFIVVMVMMVMMTLFVVSAINLSNVNLKIVFNLQKQRENEAVAQQAIDRIISVASNFSFTPAGTDICKDGTLVAAGGCTGANVKVGFVEAPACTFSKIKEGYSKKLDEMPIEETMWEVRATIHEPGDSSRVLARIRQGVLIPLLADNCAL